MIRALRSVLKCGVALLVLAVAGGQLLGEPVLFSYVTTGSMAPTLAPGDGFLVAPGVAAGTVAEGDVVVFRAEHLHGGGLVTHRVVGKTDGGYVTRGDANPFTDQAGSEPPVAPDRVKARAIEVGGRPVTIPHLGTALVALRTCLESTQRRLAVALGTRKLLGPQGLGYLLAAGGAVIAVWGYASDGGRTVSRDGTASRRRTRPGVRSGLVALAVAAVVVAPATGAMLLSAETHEYAVVSSASPSEATGALAPRETVSFEYTISNDGVAPVIVLLDPSTEGVSIHPRDVFVPGGSSETVRVSITASEEVGAHDRSFDRRQYFAVLPPDVLRALSEASPLAPIVVVDAVIAGAFSLPPALLLGRRRIMVRNRRSGSGGPRR